MLLEMKKAQEILDKGQLDSEVATGVCVRAELAEVEEFFPRLLGQHEDNAHASTRLTQRGWAGVPELKECYMMMVGSPTSPCRILQSSEQWQKPFRCLHPRRNLSKQTSHTPRHCNAQIQQLFQADGEASAHFQTDMRRGAGDLQCSRQEVL